MWDLFASGCFSATNGGATTALHTKQGYVKNVENPCVKPTRGAPSRNGGGHGYGNDNVHGNGGGHGNDNGNGYDYRGSRLRMVGLLGALERR